MAKEQNRPSLPPLNLPPVDVRIRKDGNILKIFDPFRGKYVALTPEEYVRRHFSEYLASELHYPKSNIANEIKVEVNGRQLRCDTLVTDAYGAPLMIVEYKAPSVNITQEVFDQIVRYNMTLRARYLVVSNGMHHYCCEADYENNRYHFLSQVPEYDPEL